MKKYLFLIFGFMFSFLLINSVNAETMVIDYNSNHTNFEDSYKFLYNNFDYLNSKILDKISSNSAVLDKYNNSKKIIYLKYSSSSLYIYIHFFEDSYNFPIFSYQKISSVSSYYYYLVNINHTGYMLGIFSFDNKDFGYFDYSNYNYLGGWNGITLSSSFGFLYSDFVLNIDYTDSPYDSINYFGNLIQDNILFYKDVYGGSKVPILYNIKFNIPSGSTFILKDSLGNVINPFEENIYSLESGKYYYSVYKDLFIPLEDIELIVNEDKVIDVSLESRLNFSSYNNSFSSFYSYIGSLVPIMFNIENPFFLILLGIVIIFSLFLIIKKILKGRF